MLNGRHLKCLVACGLLSLLHGGCGAEEEKPVPTPSVEASEGTGEEERPLPVPTFDEALLARVQEALDLQGNAYIHKRDGVLIVGDKDQATQLAKVAELYDDPYVRLVAGAWRVRVENPGLVQRMTAVLDYLDNSRTLHAGLNNWPIWPLVVHEFRPIANDANGYFLVAEMYLKNIGPDYMGYIPWGNEYAPPPLGTRDNPRRGHHEVNPQAARDLIVCFVRGRPRLFYGLGRACETIVFFDTSLAPMENPFLPHLLDRLRAVLVSGDDRPPSLEEEPGWLSKMSPTAEALLHAITYASRPSTVPELRRLREMATVDAVKEQIDRIIERIPELEARRQERRQKRREELKKQQAEEEHF